MLTISPLGPAACTCALAVIWVTQGCRGAIHVQGFLEPFVKRVAGPNRFSMHRSLAAREGLIMDAVFKKTQIGNGQLTDSTKGLWPLQLSQRQGKRGFNHEH